MTPDVSVVIVSWNTREHLARCLAAVPAAGAGLRLEVVVVDNASADGSAEMVAAAFPGVRLLRNADNLGFGRACNQGAAAGGGRAILFLNSDCEPAPGALARLLAVLDAEAAIGAVFCRLVNADGSLQPSVHGALPSPWHVLGDVFFASSLRYLVYRHARLGAWLLGRQRRRHAVAHDVAWGGAACMLVRRAAFERVGGFDPRFFMYSEDVDLCAALGAAGYRLRYVPAAVAVHHWGVSTVQRPAAMVEAAYRSRVAYFDKHAPGGGAAVVRRLTDLELAARSVVLGALARWPGRHRTALAQRAAASAACRRALRGVPAAAPATGARA